MRFLLAVYYGSDSPTGVELEVVLDWESMVIGYECWMLGDTVHQSTYRYGEGPWQCDRKFSERERVPQAIHRNEAGYRHCTALFPIRSRSHWILRPQL